MALTRKVRPDSEIDVGAFSDIAFLLIIFFILTTSIVKISGRELAIPSAEKSKAKEERENLTVSIGGSSLLFGLGKSMKEVTLPELRAQLFLLKLDTKKTDMDRMVVVEGKDDVPYEIYFQVVSAISESGGILALMEEEEAAPGKAKEKAP